MTSMLKCDKCGALVEAPRLPQGWTIFSKESTPPTNPDAPSKGLGHYCPKCNGNAGQEKKR